MHARLFAAAVLAASVVAPLRSQSIAGARIGLTPPVPAHATALRDAPTRSAAGRVLVSSSGASGDRWAKGMVAGALVGLIVGLLININQLQNGGTHSAILPAVGVGALVGLLIGTG